MGGFFTGPTKDEVGESLSNVLEGQTVRAFVIGQLHGRTAIVATDEAVHVIPIGMFKVRANRRLASYPLGSVPITRSGLWLTAGEYSVKLGMADNARAKELVEFVNSASAR